MASTRTAAGVPVATTTTATTTATAATTTTATSSTATPAQQGVASTTVPAQTTPIRPVPVAVATTTSAAPALPPTPAAIADPASSVSLLPSIVLGASIIVAGYAFLRGSKQNTSDSDNDNGNCDSIKALLDAKKQEFIQFTHDWPANKLEAFAMDRITHKGLKTAINVGTDVKAKYDSLQDAIALLQQKYDFCTASLPSMPTKIFIAFYQMPVEGLEEWMSKSAEDRKEIEEKMKEECDAWIEAHKSSVTKTVAFDKAKRVNTSKAEDVKNGLMLSSYVEAGSLKAAAEIFKDHPHLQLPGGTIEVIETREI